MESICSRPFRVLDCNCSVFGRGGGAENARPENDGPGHVKADVVCMYAFCVVYNFSRS